MEIFFNSGTPFGYISQLKKKLYLFLNPYIQLDKGHVRSLKTKIRMMNEMEEWSVRIFCDRKILLAQIDDFSKDAAILEEKIMASSPGKAYLLQRKKSELVKTEMVRICDEFTRSCLSKFRNLSNSCIINNLVPGEALRRENTNILNISLVISREEVSKLKSTYDVIFKNYGIPGFTIETSGPHNLKMIRENDRVSQCNK